MKDRFAVIAGEACDYFRFLSDTGCPGVDCSKQSLGILNAWESGPADLPEPEVTETLDHIRKDLGSCGRCKLSEKRNSIVFGEGSPNARLVFVGEAPGYDEDRSGRPFVGKAGQLLTKIIQAMKLAREEVYICNVLKCRPPGNRNPEDDEIKACSPFLARQLAAIKPEFICTLGKFAAQMILETDESISRLRGRFFDYKGMKLMPTFHPSYLLRNPGKKREVWEDVQKIMKEYGL